VRTDFDATARRLDLYLDFPEGPASPALRGTSPPARSTTPSPRPGGTWTSSSTTPGCTPASHGVTCPTHGTRQVALPWARQGSAFTLLFEALRTALLAEMPVKAVADQVGEHDTRLWRLLHHHVEQARAALDLGGVSRAASTKPPPSAGRTT
jgi:transposase